MSEKAIVVACDHAAVALKEALLPVLSDWGWQVEDLGTHGPESVDYPDYAERVAQRVVSNPEGRGLLLCGSGVGMCIAANKIRGARAALCAEPYSSAMARAHNDANILCLGARVVGVDLATAILKAFVETPFEGGRHARRVEKIVALEA